MDGSFEEDGLRGVMYLEAPSNYMMKDEDCPLAGDLDQ